MSAPTIVATGSVTSANTAGISKEYVNLETLTFTDPANPSPSSENWELIDAPPGQTSTVQNPTTSTPTLVLDSDFGTFRIRHTADGDVGELVFAVLTTGVLTERIPGYLEQDDARAISTEGTWNKASNIKGWFPALHALLKSTTSDQTQYLLVDGTRAMTGALTISGGGITSSEDADESFIFGRTRIDSRASTLSYISHYDRDSISHYALRHATSGQLILNGSAAGSLYLALDNALKFEVTETLLEGIGTSAGALAQASATVTVPSLIPNKLSTTTGVGGTSGTINMIVASTSALLLDASRDATFAGDITAAENTDGTFIFGRNRIDSRATDAAYFSHYDRPGTTEYAILQTQAGATAVNSASGQLIRLRIAGTTHFYLSTTAGFTSNTAGGPALFNRASTATVPSLVNNSSSTTTGMGGVSGEVDLIIAGASALNIDSSKDSTFAGTIAAIADTDGDFIFGKARIDARTTDVAHFSHYDQGATGAYAVRQNASGQTHINSAAGQLLRFRIGGVTQYNLTGTSFRSDNTGGPRLLNEAASATNPTLCPDGVYPNSGIGGGSPANAISVISNSVEACTWDGTSMTQAGEATFEADVILEGDLRHGDRTITIMAHPGNASNSAGTLLTTLEVSLSDWKGRVNCNGVGNIVVMPISLPTGSRIKTVAYYYFGNTTATKRFSLIGKLVAGSHVATIHETNTTALSGHNTYTQTVSPQVTMSAGDTLWAQYRSGASSDRMYYVIVTYDHP